MMKNNKATTKKIKVRLKSKLDDDGFFRNTLIKAEIKNINAQTKEMNITSKNTSVRLKENILTFLRQIICLYFTKTP